MLKTETMTLNVGPQHPSTHGVLRVMVELDGDIIKDCKSLIGYLHRGIEKIAEHRNYEQILPFTDRFEYVSSASNNLVYVQTVEKLLGIEVPERAQYIRVLLAELWRISSHLIWFASTPLDVGGMTPLFYAFRERETLRDIMEMITGARMTTSYLRIGGVREDLPSGAIDKILDFTERFPEQVDEYEKLVTTNRIFIGRMKGIGILSPEDCLKFSLSGPLLRGSGIKKDLRKDEPYAVYDQLDFDIPVGKNGDSYDRYLIRMEEMRETNRLIKKIIKQMPGGKIKADVPDFIRPSRDNLHQSIEDLVHYFYLTLFGGSPPKGEVYSCVESPRGEFGCYIVSDGSPRPFRIKFRSPSYVNLGALPTMVKGSTISDLVVSIASIDICLGEVDR